MKIDESTSMSKIEYFDFLRVISFVAVVAIHVAASNWYGANVISFDWKLFNLCSSLSCWAVPVFVMISGTLFLQKKYTIKRILTKNVFHIVTAFLFWSMLYAVYEYYMGKVTMKRAFFLFLEGQTHMWFMYMIVGLYLLVPLLVPIVQSRELTNYFLITAFLFAGVVPSIRDWLANITIAFEYMIDVVLDSVAFNIVSIYPFYFVFGYMLHKWEIPSVWRKRIYLIGVLSAIVTAVGSSVVSMWKNEPLDFLFQKYGINVAGMATAVFVFAKYHFSYDMLNNLLSFLMKELSKYSFGAYLVHFLILSVLQDVFGIHTQSFHPALAVPIIILIVSVCSFSVSAILNRIPVVKKFLV